MLRRSFLGAVLSSIPLLRAQADNSIEKYLAPLNTEGMGLILIDNKYIRDPFIKVYTQNGHITKYNNYFHFEQKNSTVILHRTSRYKNIYHHPWHIPLQNTLYQSSESKLNFIKYVKKENHKYKQDSYLFEIIADNKKSQLIAFADNDDKTIEMLEPELRELGTYNV